MINADHMLHPNPILAAGRKIPRILLRRLHVILPILLVAMALRVGYMPGYGHVDLSNSVRWTQTIQHVGVLNFYAQPDPDRFYPPLALSIMGITAYLPGATGPDESTMLVLLKLFPVLFDLALIALCYFYLRDDPILNWLIPLILTFSHGLTLVSAWWGQTDSQFTLLVVLSLIALNKDRPISAWVFFSLALLMKQQSVVITPLLLILTFRRYGLATLIKCAATAVLVGALVLAPFMAGSGLENALKPYLEAANAYPVATVNALNMWYILTPHQKTEMPFPFDAVPDRQALIGPLTYRQVGLLLLGIYVVTLCDEMWRNANKRREFVWATALYLGVFILATQIHERYLYPAAVLAVISIAQDRGMWPLALGLMYTFTYNVAIIAPARVRFLWPQSLALHISWLNLLIFIEVTQRALLAFSPQFNHPDKPLDWSWLSLKGGLILCRVGAALIALSLIVALVTESAADYPTAKWLAEHLPNDAQLLAERSEVVRLTRDWDNTSQWRWRLSTKIEDKPVARWAQEGVQYMLVDSRASFANESFAERLKKLVEQGSIIVYESSNRAVLLNPSPTAPHSR